MAIAVGFSGAYNPTPASGVSTQAGITLGSGVTLLLVAIGNTSGAYGGPSAVTFGGTSLTKIGFEDSGGNSSGFSIWYLASPPTTSSSLVITNNSAVTGCLFNVLGLTGTATSGVIGASNLAASNSPCTATCTIASGSALVAFETDNYTQASDTTSFTSGFTEIAGAKMVNSGSPGTEIHGYINTSPSSGSNPFKYTSSASFYLNVGLVEVVPSAAAAQTITVGPSTITAALSAITLALSLVAGPLSAVSAPGAVSLTQAIVSGPATLTGTPGAVTVGNTITSGPLALTSATGAVTVNQSIVAGPSVMAATLGPVTVAATQNITVSPLTMTGSAPSDVTVQSGLTIFVAPLTATLTPGPVTVTVPQFITAAPLTLAGSVGSVQLLNPQTFSVNPLTLTGSLGPVSVLVPQFITDGGPLIGTLSLGPVTITTVPSPVITINHPPSGTLSLPSDVHVFESQNIAVSGLTLTATLGVAHIQLAPLIITVGPLVGKLTLSSVVVQQGQTTFAPYNHGSANFNVQLDAPSTGDTTVSWYTVDGSAVAPGDYVAASGTLFFNEGATREQITVYYTFPGPGAPQKQFQVVISSPNDAHIVSGVATAVIPAGSQVVPVVPPTLTIGTGSDGTTTPSTPSSPSAQTITIAPLTAALTIGAASLTQASTGLTFLTATGNALHDAAGNKVVLQSVNWYGMAGSLTPLGLDQRPYKTITTSDGVVHEGILDQIKRLGFNSVRFLICEDITWSTTSGSPVGWTAANGRRPVSSTTDSRSTYINPTLNPDFFLANANTPLYAVPQPFISSLEMLDLIAAHAFAIGIRLILDMHALAPDNNDNTGNSRTVGGQLDTSTDPTTGLPNWIVTKKWFTTVNPGDAGANAGATYELRNEAQFFAAWLALAARYANQPAVCGFDLINEPAGGTWAASKTNDIASSSLPSMYERLGAQIQAVNPGVLIVCEGSFTGIQGNNIDFGPGPAGGGANEIIQGSFFSGDLRNAATRPVVLPTAGKVVYSPHEYMSAGGEALSGITSANQLAWGSPTPKGLAHWYEYDPTFPKNMSTASTGTNARKGVWNIQWGYLVENNIAPVWIGEIGADFTVNSATTQNNINSDDLWISEFAQYSGNYNVGWAWFALNPEGPGAPLGLTPQVNGSWDPAGSVNAFQMTQIDVLLAAQSGQTIYVSPLTITSTVNGGTHKVSVVATGQTNTYGDTGVNLNGATMLVVAVGWQNGSTPPTSVTYAGAALTEVTGTVATGNNDSSGAAIYYLLNPASGANALYLSGGSPGSSTVTFIGVTGNKTTAPIGASGFTATANPQTATSLTLTGVVSTSTLFVAESSIFYSSSSPTFSSGWTLSPDVCTATNREGHAYYNGSPAVGSNTFTFTNTAAAMDLNLVGVEILAA